MGKYGPEEWWYPTGAPAANVQAIVFEADQSTFASIYSDAGLTTPLPNPTTTDASGLLEFYAVDGEYWVYVGDDYSGDSELVTIGPAVTGAVLSVNGQTGVVVLDATDVGADPTGSAAAAAAASQPLATIDAKGDLYAGTANNTTARRSVGADGTVLTADAADPTGMSWQAPAPGGVTSVNGETGVVVLDATDVGADPAGSAAAAQAAAIAASLQKAQNLADLPNPGTARTNLGLGNSATLNVGTAAGTVAAGDDSRIVGAQQRVTLTTKGDLYVATAAATVTRKGVGADGTVLTASAADPTGMVWQAPASAPVTSVNGETGVVVLDATDVGADPAGSAAAAQAAAIAASLQKAQNLADLPNPGTARTNLGLGGAATLNVGTTAGTVAAGDDSRIVNALPVTIIDAKGDLILGSAADTAVRVPVGANGRILSANSAQTGGVEWIVAPSGGGSKTVEFTDDRKVITTGNGSARWYNRQGALTIVGAWVSAGVQPTGAAILVDVNLNGTTIFTTQGNRPTVTAGTNGGGISATPDVTALAVGDYLTVDIDQIGSTIPGGLITIGIVVQ